MFSTVEHKLATAAVLTCMICLAKGILGQRVKTERGDARSQAVFSRKKQSRVFSLFHPRTQKGLILAVPVAPLVSDLKANREKAQAQCGAV